MEKQTRTSHCLFYKIQCTICSQILWTRLVIGKNKDTRRYQPKEDGALMGKHGARMIKGMKFEPSQESPRKLPEATEMKELMVPGALASIWQSRVLGPKLAYPKVGPWSAMAHALSSCDIITLLNQITQSRLFLTALLAQLQKDWRRVLLNCYRSLASFWRHRRDKCQLMMVDVLLR